MPGSHPTITFQEVRALLAGGQGDSSTFQELRDALSAAAYDELGPGKLAAAHAARPLRIRREMAASGKDVSGLDELLLALDALPPAEQVLLFHFAGAEKVFSVLVSEKSGQLLGCVRVKRDKPTNSRPVRRTGRGDPKDRN